MRALGWPSEALDLEWIDVPAPNGTRSSHPVICPALRDDPTNGWEKFESSLRGPHGDAQAFGQGFQTHFACPDDAGEHTVARMLHGESAATNNVDGLFTMVLNSLHSTSVTRDSKLVYSNVRKSDITDGTLEPLWARLAWSMNALAALTHPERDWAGRSFLYRGLPVGLPVARKWRAATGWLGIFQPSAEFPQPDADAMHVLALRGIPKWGLGLEPHESWCAVAHHDCLLFFKIQTLRLESV